ncbi:MAG: two-component sensor histidine kinase, partial [Rhodospirillaceae bacterium]|nr:two-component sensor histidine kinase [Rhodospirillaceae bacterium]
MTSLRFFPRSLLGRSLLIIGLPIVMVQVISLWFFYDRHVQTISRRMALHFAQSIELTLNHIREYNTTKDLDWMISELRNSQDMQVWFRKGQSLKGKSHKNIDDLVGREILREFRQTVNARFVIDGDYDDQHIQILVEVAGGIMDIVAKKKKIRTITTDLYVVWSIGASSVLLIIAVLFMLNQVRSIRALAAAASQFGKGRDVPDFKPWGAREVRQAATAFLIMRERIRRQLAQRANMLAGVSHDL